MATARYHKVKIGEHELNAETLMLGYGYDPSLSEGSVKPPVFLTFTFVFQTAEQGRAAKLERRRIKERTARGRADAQANGVKFGRKPKLTPHQKREAIKRRDREGETLRSIGRSYNVSAATIGRLAQ